ncbi:MGMT family protein [Candidatus Uhrbacteria bacterium]|nr:MGMT family protein [Candidatus Uhrbacteria bacterium]
MTYAEVARAAGRPRAYRAVGNILNRNFDPAIPCHRVIRSDGTPGGYNRGTERKMELLRSEIVPIPHPNRFASSSASVRVSKRRICIPIPSPETL